MIDIFVVFVISVFVGPSLPMIGIHLFLRTKRLIFGINPASSDDDHGELTGIGTTKACTEITGIEKSQSSEEEDRKKWKAWAEDYHYFMLACSIKDFCLPRHRTYSRKN